MPPRTGARVLLRWRYGAAALTMSVLLVIPVPAPANASAGLLPGSRFAQELLNRAAATVAKSGRTVIAVRFRVRESHAAAVDAVNRATALADGCGSCDAVAVAVQVAFVSQQHLADINAENTAEATNYHCTTVCSALAEAYQIVIADGDSTQPTPKQAHALREAAAGFYGLRRPGLDNAQIQSRSADILSQLVSALADRGSGTPAAPAMPLTPALNRAQPAQLTQTSGPVIDVYRDVQSSS